MRNVLELNKILENGEEYKAFLKNIGLDNMVSYPLYIYKDYFLSENVLGLIKIKETFLYNEISKKIKELDVSEIKVDSSL